MTDLCMNKMLATERIVLLPLPEHDVDDNKTDVWYAIVDRENRTPVGMIGMVHRHPEWKNTGLWIMIPDKHNRREGYGLEALELMEQYIFEGLAYQRIAVGIAECNQAAVHLFKRAGYKLEGVQELGCFCNNQYCGVILLRLLRKEYMGRQ